MAFSNQTTHYGLPLPTGSDKSSWLDTNEAFQAVDTALYNAVQASGGSSEELELLRGDVSTLQSNLATTNSNLTAETASRTSADASLQSSIDTVSNSASSNHASLVSLSAEVAEIKSALNTLIDDMVMQNVDGTWHSNATKTGMSASTSVSFASNNLYHRPSAFTIRNNTDAAINLTGGVYMQQYLGSTPGYVIPFFTLPKAFMDNHYTHLATGYYENAARLLYVNYTTSATSRVFRSSAWLVIGKQSNGSGVCGYLNEGSATMSLAGRYGWTALPLLLNKQDANADLPDDVESAVIINNYASDGDDTE